MATNLTIKLVLLTLASLMCQQFGNSETYIESWKKGARQVQEQTIQIELNAVNPECERLVKDISGKPAYKLSIWPGYVSKRGSGILEWTVELKDLKERRDLNLLKPSNDPGQDYFTARDRVGWLYPLEDPKVLRAESDVIPILARRVIKIESFYCIIKVKQYRFAVRRKGILDSITVQIQFTNNYPK